MRNFLVSLVTFLVLLLAYKADANRDPLYDFLSWLPRFPGGGNQSPTMCTFNGPSDGATLHGQNFIGNYGTGTCLSYEQAKWGSLTHEVSMGVCAWSSLPRSEQLYYFKNGNGGTIVKPTVSGSFGSESCLTTTKFGGVLAAEKCDASGKNPQQTWQFRKIRQNLYQVIQMDTGKCLKADSMAIGTSAKLVRCNGFDRFQLWRICTSK